MAQTDPRAKRLTPRAEVFEDMWPKFPSEEQQTEAQRGDNLRRVKTEWQDWEQAWLPVLDWCSFLQSFCLMPNTYRAL